MYLLSATHRLGRKVGFRYLTSKKSSRFLSVITAISIGGVGIGVLTMIVTLSVMSGFEDELKKRLFQAETHVLIESNESFFKSSDQFISDIQASTSSVKNIYPVLSTEVILRSGKKVTGSVVKGVGANQLDWVRSQVVEWASSDVLTQDAAGTPRIFVGSEMAFDMGLMPGDFVTMVSPVEADGPFGAVPRVKRFVVEGIYKTGIPDQELHVVFSAAANIESFLRQEGILNAVEVRVGSLDDAPRAARDIAQKLGPNFLVRSWQQLNAHLFHSLELERIAMFCILIFIVIVASFNIISTLTMMVLEKKRSLSILRAMGATKRQIGAIFLWEGLAIGLVGVCGGTALGLAICYGLKRYPLIELPEYFYDRTLPVHVHPDSIILVACVALAIVLLGALMPARKASDLPPIQGIREG